MCSLTDSQAVFAASAKGEGTMPSNTTASLPRNNSNAWCRGSCLPPPRRMSQIIFQRKQRIHFDVLIDVSKFKTKRVKACELD